MQFMNIIRLALLALTALCTPVLAQDAYPSKPIRILVGYAAGGGNEASDLEAAKVILWHGFCSVHRRFTVDQIDQARREHPGVQVIVHPECPMAVVDAADHDRVLGSCGLHELASGRADIGYWVARDARGRGIAPRAARLLRDYAIEVLGLPRVEVLVHPENTASQRAAQKAGFHRTGEYRPSPRNDDPGRADLVVFAWPDDGGAGAGAG